MKEICKLDLGRWSATVSKVEPGSLEHSPDATLRTDVWCDGVSFGWSDNGKCHKEEYRHDPDDFESAEEFAERHGLAPLTEGDDFDLHALVTGTARLCRHIEKGGSVEEWNVREKEEAIQSLEEWTRELKQSR